MFAALNTFRHKLILNTNWKTLSCHSPHLLLGQVREIQLVLEQVIATADQELTSRKVSFTQTPNKTVVSGYGSVPLRNTVSCPSLFTLSLSHLAAAVSSMPSQQIASPRCSNFVTCLLLVQTKRLFAKKEDPCKKSLTSLLCH